MPPTDEFPTATPAPLASTLPGGDPAGGPDPFESWVLHSVGRYQLDTWHRDGGLGRVWKAHDPLADRPVALKQVRPDRAGDPALADRLVREARVTAQLEHPNIVPLYDLVAGPDGPAYVMRFLPAQTLAGAATDYHKRLKAGEAGPLDLAKLLDAVVLVCRAVGYAHGRGVLHRDLKGQNVLLGDHAQVCLADWGLAKRAGEADRPGDPHPLSPADGPDTAPGAIMGTPAFMAPEVARGEPAGVPSDVYGLGAVLYQVLTDRVPHAGSTPKEVLGRVQAGDPVLPPRRLNPAVPPALDAVCLKALARRPADRYASADALADDLRRFLAGEPVVAYPEPLLTRLGRRARRHKAAVLAGVVSLAVLAVAATTTAALVYREKERTAAKQREAEEQRDKYQAMLGAVRDYSDSLTDVVTEAETGATAGRRTVADRAAALGRAVAAAERLLAATPGDPDLQARLVRLLWYTGNLARVRNDRPTAEKALDAAAALAAGLAAAAPAGDWAAHSQHARLLDDRAMLSEVYGRLPAAAAALDESAGVLRGLPDNPAVRRALALNRLQRAELDTRLGRLPEARAGAGQAADLFAGLAAEAAGRHFLDASHRGAALTARAVAHREGGHLGPALADHAAAVDALRLAAETDERPDVRHLYHLGVYEQTVTRRRAGHPPAALLADAARCVAAWRGLVARDPGVAMHRRALGRGLTLWAGLWADAAPGEPLARGAAAAGQLEAAGTADRLRADAPDRASYWADTARAYAGLGRLQAGAAGDDPAARLDAEKRFRQAHTSAKRAAALAADDKQLDRLPADILREAAGFRFDLSAKLNPGR